MFSKTDLLWFSFQNWIDFTWVFPLFADWAHLLKILQTGSSLSEAAVSLVERKLMEADRLKMCGMMWLKEHETCSPMDAMHSNHRRDSKTVKCRVFSLLSSYESSVFSCDMKPSQESLLAHNAGYRYRNKIIDWDGFGFDRSQNVQIITQN